MDLKKAWCRETAHPSYQKDWTENNPAYGQCLVTALVMQDIVGGEIYECKVKNKRHYFNVLEEGTLWDLTKSQFTKNDNEKIVYTNIRPRTRVSLLKSKSVRERYELLKSRYNY
jgi:hypothetical protein